MHADTLSDDVSLDANDGGSEAGIVRDNLSPMTIVVDHAAHIEHAARHTNAGDAALLRGELAQVVERGKPITGADEERVELSREERD